ncbi:MAG: amidohydrolase [Vicinamibacterales bacterium]
MNPISDEPRTAATRVDQAGEAVGTSRATVVDIHPHVISDDDVSYPRAPLFGKQSTWSQERPVTVEAMIAAMDDAGVDKAAVVQSSTCYGFDNSYVADACARFPDRLAAIGSVDMVQPDAPDRIREWVDRGVVGLRLFTGGSTNAFDASLLDDPRTFPSWALCGDLGLSMCIQTNPAGLAQVAGLARRFPGVRIVLDHLGRPDVSDGPPYLKAASLFALAPLGNVYLKLTPRIFVDAAQSPASPETFFPRLVEAFGADRLAWGSNFPASSGTMAANLVIARAGLQTLTAADRAWIFGKTAQVLYPPLADA